MYTGSVRGRKWPREEHYIKKIIFFFLQSLSENRLVNNIEKHTNKHFNAKKYILMLFFY